jgi:hypothetical protein
MLHPRWIFNSHNSHVQAKAKSHAASVHCHQQHFVVNVWVGNVNDFLIGTYLLPQQLRAEIYQVCLEEKLPEMLEDILPSIRRNMWFQQGRAAAHFACQV